MSSNTPGAEVSEQYSYPRRGKMNKRFLAWLFALVSGREESPKPYVDGDALRIEVKSGHLVSGLAVGLSLGANNSSEVNNTGE